MRFDDKRQTHTENANGKNCFSSATVNVVHVLLLETCSVVLYGLFMHPTNHREKCDIDRSGFCRMKLTKKVVTKICNRDVLYAMSSSTRGKLFKCRAHYKVHRVTTEWYSVEIRGCIPWWHLCRGSSVDLYGLNGNVSTFRVRKCNRVIGDWLKRASARTLGQDEKEHPSTSTSSFYYSSSNFTAEQLC